MNSVFAMPMIAAARRTSSRLNSAYASWLTGSGEAAPSPTVRKCGCIRMPSLRTTAVSSSPRSAWMAIVPAASVATSAGWA